MLFRLALQFAEQLPPVVRQELEQLIAAIQQQSNNIVSPRNLPSIISTDGSPVAGELAKFASPTSVTNGDLSGDVSTAGTLVTAIGAGKVTEAMQVLADNTTQNVSTTKHGYAPKGDGSTSKFLNANGAYSAPSASGGGAMTLIAENLLGSDTATVTFSTIPSTYRHLRVIMYGRTTDAGSNAGVFMRFNGDNGGNYDYQRSAVSHGTLGDSAAYAQNQADIGDLPGAGSSSAAQVGLIDILIGAYALTTFNKFATVTMGSVYGTATTSAKTESLAIMWRNTAAITQLDFFPTSGNFKAGCLFSIYGWS